MGFPPGGANVPDTVVAEVMVVFASPCSPVLFTRFEHVFSSGSRRYAKCQCRERDGNDRNIKTTNHKLPPHVSASRILNLLRALCPM